MQPSAAVTSKSTAISRPQLTSPFAIIGRCVRIGVLLVLSVVAKGKPSNAIVQVGVFDLIVDCDSAAGDVLSPSLERQMLCSDGLPGSDPVPRRRAPGANPRILEGHGFSHDMSREVLNGFRP
jgi:hypothetical protein